MAKRKSRGSPAARSAEGGGGSRGFYLAIAAVVVVGTFFLLRAGGSDQGGGAAVPSVAETTSVQPDATVGVPTGPEDAPAVIIEFADFLCPHCRTFNAVTGKLLRQNYAVDGGPLRWISYEFPLWPESWLPGLAARCAAEQGRYWEMHDLLFARVDSWRNEAQPTRKFVAYSKDLGLDGRSFETCVVEKRYVQHLQASKAFGEQLGVGGTPTLFFNGERVESTVASLSYEGLERRILEVAGRATAE